METFKQILDIVAWAVRIFGMAYLIMGGIQLATALKEHHGPDQKHAWIQLVSGAAIIAMSMFIPNIAN